MYIHCIYCLLNGNFIKIFAIIRLFSQNFNILFLNYRPVSCVIGNPGIFSNLLLVLFLSENVKILQFSN